jgi:transposase
VARAACRRGNPYLRLRDELGPIFCDRDFLPVYANPGHPATSPALLALVTVLQYMEHLSDAQAADAMRTRLDWKYLLGLPLEDEGVDASVLSEFRTRLVAKGREQLLLDRLVTVLRERGLIKERGTQRTDSTRVVGAVRSLNRLELVGETMRFALNTLAIEAPTWLLAHGDPAWATRYHARIAAARLPESAAGRERLAQEIGQDGMTLLAALDAPEAPGWLRDLAAIRTLRQVWAQQYETGSGGPRLRPADALPPAAELLCSPYDPDVRFAVIRETGWTGYRLHLTETCDPDRPRLVVSAEITPAPAHDCRALAPIQARLQERAVLPGEQLVDSGYVTGPEVRTSAQTHRITLIGPIQRDTSWQARAGEGCAAPDFAIDWEHEQAICPQGKRSSTWRPVRAAGGKPVIQIHFRQADCGACSVKAQCTRADRRSLTVQPQPIQEALVQARAYQATTAFATTYALRAGIEGTISQAVRRTGARVARYRGAAKMRLQAACTAVALDLARLADWFGGDRPTTFRTSAYARLMAQAA